MYRNRMILLVSIAILLAALLTVNSARAGQPGLPLAQSGAPQVVSYQGQVAVGGEPYTGTGYFKFAVVNQAGNTTYWSNDGSASGEPAAAITTTVSGGLFNVLLGDTTRTNMTALPASAFDGTERYLRVWFSSDGSTFTLLSPDRRISAVPYALQAEEARNAATASEADTLDGQHASTFAGSVHDHDTAYVNEGQADSVTSVMLVNGTLALEDIGQNGCSNGQVMQWNGTAWACANVTGVTDHGALTGLADDDHPLYFNLSQAETVTGIPAFNGGTTGASAPFSVSSSFLVTNLNADLLDGQHGAFYQSASNVNAGTLGTAYYSAYSDLTAEGYLDNNASTDLLTQSQSDARFVNEGQADSITSAMITNGAVASTDLADGATLAEIADDDGSGSGLDTDLLDGQQGAFYQNTSNLNAGTLGTAYYSAYSDLTAEGYLDNNASTDLLTQGQSDARFVNEGQADSITSAMITNGAVTGTDLADGATLAEIADDDGSGSGLDADLLDGQHGVSYQARVSGTCVAGSTVQSINADGTVVCHSDAPLNRQVQPLANTLTTVDASNNSNGPRTSATIGVDGLPLISYFDGVSRHLKVAHCSDLSCSTSVVTTLDTGTIIGSVTSIVIGSDKLGLIGYYDLGKEDFKVAHCSDIACTSATLTTYPSSSNIGADASGTIGIDGLGLFSFYDATNGALAMAHCSNINCTSATLSPVHVVGNSGRATSIALGSDGLGVVSFYDGTNRTLKVAHCDNIPCTSVTVQVIEVVSSMPDVYVSTSITIGDDGLPLIAYYNSVTNNLKVVHCNNVTCGTFNSTALDSGGNVGLYTSIMIGADGLGFISYQDETNAFLKTAHCSNTACTSAVVVTVDKTGTVGGWTSVTLGVDGLPFISYFDQTNGHLKAAHCSNTFCLPYFRRR